MTCPCKCCVAGKPCARVLMLSPADEAQARRMWENIARFGEVYVPRSISLSTTPEQSRSAQDVEPVENAACPGCGGSYPLASYLAAFLRDHGARIPDCPGCMGAGQTSWEAA